MPLFGRKKEKGQLKEVSYKVDYTSVQKNVLIDGQRGVFLRALGFYDAFGPDEKPTGESVDIFFPGLLIADVSDIDLTVVPGFGSTALKYTESDPDLRIDLKWFVEAMIDEVGPCDAFVAEGKDKQGRLWRACVLDRGQTLLQEAKHSEAVERYEDAARIYEKLGMYEEAKMARRRGKGITVVSVDLNRLLEQVRNSGIVAVYRCPKCGGNLKIGKDTSTNSLRICPYCGSEIAAMDLADFIRTILS